MSSPAASSTKKAPCADSACGCAPTPQLKPFAQTPLSPPGACCGSAPAPASDADTRPGYTICHFVERFMDTPAGPVPVVRTALGWRDHLGTAGARSGINRDNYAVAPGLYAVGEPDPDAPILVTANYKLSFDTLRRRLPGINAWLLVLDTLGVNVWCAAGKGTFGTDELVRRIEKSGLAKVVSHKTLILPQLGATGVSAIAVKKQSGFSVIWGPIRADDIPAFINTGMKAGTGMRMVTFTTAERVVLIPMELSIVLKYLIWVVVGAAVISGIGPGIFSFGQALHRGMLIITACLGGVVAGCVLTPALLPWIPGTAFAAKGALLGGAAGIATVAAAGAGTGRLEAVLMVLCAAALSSFLAMNFTGATPFTSPSGVEKEMRRAIPLQLAAVALVVFGWIGAAFL
ncbi:MAG: mercury methylation corrinoid protein HgcA [Pseudomonadota bacterium]